MGQGGASEQGSGEWIDRSSALGGPPGQVIYKIGIYGWRKRCLYLIILLLIAIVIINLALTIWMLKVMDFSIDGMGRLRMTDEGVRVEGDAEFLKALYTSNIRSKPESGLHVESARNITLRARNNQNVITNVLSLGSGKIMSQANRFELRGRNGDVVFSADRNEIFVGAEKLTVSGDTGATFSKSVQTPLVKPEGTSPLRLESPTKGVHINAPGTVSLKAGNVNLDSIGDIRLHSLKGTIHINAKNITLKNLYISRPRFNGQPYPEVYQLCVCGRGNGRIFLSPAVGNCQATNDVCT